MSVFIHTDETDDIEKMNKEGRFPANLLLECTCEEVIEGKSDGVVINNTNSQSINDTIYKLGHSKGEQEAPRAYKDTGTIHTDSNCPCKKLDIQWLASAWDQNSIEFLKFSSPSSSL